MSSHELAKVVEAADDAINAEDFDALMDFYAEDATLVVRPGLNATGKEQIRNAFEAIAEYFNHTLKVRQGGMQVIEGGDTALVLARTLLDVADPAGTASEIERLATYVFKREDGAWRCTVDNSYGTGLLSSESTMMLHR